MFYEKRRMLNTDPTGINLIGEYDIIFCNIYM